MENAELFWAVKVRLWLLVVVFLSCPLVKKHADLFGSFLY